MILPSPIKVVAKDCGEENAFYTPETSEITMCYEWLAVFMADAEKQYRAVEGEVLVDVLAARQPQRQERSHQLEVALLERGRRPGRVAEVAGRPELGALVAGLGDRVEHVDRIGQAGVVGGELEDAERDGRGCDPHAVSFPVIGTRVSRVMPGQASRVQARSGSSSAAIDRFSAASAFR